MQRLILENFQAPGDIVTLTAALRDLHRCYPNQFLTDVRTAFPELWRHNPYLTSLRRGQPGVRTIECHYPLIRQSNTARLHFIHGFIHHLNEQLNLQIKLTEFKGDIHLSDEEKLLPSPVEEAIDERLPYWIVVAGGKYDFTIKWWHFRRYQQVVDHFDGKLAFVQVGEKGHFHPPLKRVIDLRGRTTLRDLVRLVYHAEGVLCPVTLAMHLAAAVEPKPDGPAHRPCVVIAGGREPVDWEAYPRHQFIHTIGALPCCATGGCWRSRIVPLGDGDDKDRPESLCVDVVNGLPRCMDMITSNDVIRRITSYTSPCGPALNHRPAAELDAWRLPGVLQNPTGKIEFNNQTTT